MHPQAADAIVESVRRRESQGDHPTEPAQSVETLENCVITLADRLARVNEDAERSPKGCTCGMGIMFAPELHATDCQFAARARLEGSNG